MRLESASLAIAATLFFGSRAARADEGIVLASGTTISQMATCDAVGKVPLLVASIFVGVRGIADGFSQSLLRTPSEERMYLVTAGTASFAHILCGPAVHLGHANYLKALESIGLRAGLPLLAYAATYGVHKATAEPGDVFGKTSTSLIVGSLSVGLTILAGFGLDYTVIARQRPSSGVAWSPAILPIEGGLSLGLGGSL